MRLIIVANRLPVSIRYDQGTPICERSPGGLVSGLATWLERLKKQRTEIEETIWIGWPGSAIPEKDRADLAIELRNQGSHPVYLSVEDMEQFYLGFCNATLWPLFHYFLVYAQFFEEHWTEYVRVNRLFADAVLEIARPDDLIWVQDYHLMLAPQMIRERIPDASIGFFLHIPWPSYEVFRLLPTQWRRGILEGLLSADLIGFHTPEYRQYFLQSAMRIMGYEHNMGRIAMPNRLALAETFPMGIEFDTWQTLARSAETVKERAELERHFKGTKLILSIDRLDYSKGIKTRLKAFARFLEKYPEWHGRVTFIVIVIPSRVGVEKYDEMKREIDREVGKVNGRFSQLHWTPIQYQFRSVPPHQLSALYRASSLAVVTPLRDGMNLIAKEYVASRIELDGVLLLSELAGSARELTEAILVNPHDIEEVAEGIQLALKMPIEDQMIRMSAMQSRLQRYDVNAWADDFMNSLSQIKQEQQRLYARALQPRDREQMIDSFQNAENRLLLLDYDGTLMPHFDHPQSAQPTDDILYLLEALCADERNQVVMISGRDKETMAAWFEPLPINLIAEHGIWIRSIGHGWRTLKPATNQWKPQILQLLQATSDRLPGAFVEEKEYSVAWHYRRSDPELAAIRAAELRDTLVNLTANIDLQVLAGKKVIEVRVSGINKGTAALDWMSQAKADFVLAIGDDWTDEDLFAVLPESAYSIRVGMVQSRARFNVRSYLDVRQLLEQMAWDTEAAR
ncbi:MAG: bifunctional alpha,alpha-trehalose-phosphate synthase (UDP-forming)/trehalose-phosphatase [bacterium]|nr:bifunctional alpha,alpha-trehalose-phosphate synthase (UDP-forming)/trehalose-phosphatase [bacterium]